MAGRTVHFVSSLTPRASLHADIDGDDDGLYNEQTDFYITSDGRDTSVLRARYYTPAGTPEAGRVITFGSDCEGLIFSKDKALTDEDGQATTAFTVKGSVKETITIYAFEPTSGVADIVTITTAPVTAGSVEIRSESGTFSVERGQSLRLVTCIFDTGGYPMPDGTYIRYSLTPRDMATVDPFGYTQSGCNTVTFIAGATAGDVTLTATSMGVSGIARLKIVNPPRPLQIIPDSGTTGVDIPFRFSLLGGKKPYLALASSQTAVITWIDDSSFEVRDSVAETLTLTVTDGEGAVVKATLVVTP